MDSDYEDPMEVEDQDEQGMGICFSTPLWMQRRQFIRQIIDENKATSVIDYGCGEAALTSLLIGETWQDHQIRRIACVDIDLDCVTTAASECQPQEYDLGDGLRVHDLTIDLYQGSVSEADQRLLGYDALACAEVVEHLHLEVLDGFWKTVLGGYSPRLVIVTTPNAEFNVNFPQLMYGTPDSTFRHWDHKFEWTRKQFEDWCCSAAQEYGYSASFTGVGRLPNQDPAVGYCTQIAVLKKTHFTPLANIDARPYTLHSSIEYPVYRTVHSAQETLFFLHETIGHLRPRLPKPEDPREHWNYFEEPDYSEHVHPKQEEESVVLGRLEMEYLWSSNQVRQHCRSRSNMVQILKTSSLVQVDVEQDLVTFDDGDLFWKECDDRYDAARAEEDEKFKEEEVEEITEESHESDDDEYYDVQGVDVDVTYSEAVDGWTGTSTWGEELNTEATGWGSRAWDQPSESWGDSWSAIPP
ncbi:Small RNA 2'-O-methyltransferase [Podila verticillata]|nr:Small RNA 2'-O-methyltransferase [Podila verticillata]